MRKRLDQFFTNDDIVDICLSTINPNNYDMVIEPSAGSGSFYHKIEHKNKIAYDIEPHFSETICYDFLETEPLVDRGKILVVGNPPFGKNSSLAVKFFNHAFLIIEGKNFKFATDPWAIGPAFNNGWWLKNKTEKDWLKELYACDFIYLSHNHPDHLNSYTLNKISKDMNIVVPKFQEDSMSGLLNNLGFKKSIVPYDKEARQFGTSNWTLKKKWKLFFDSIISFSHFPIKFMTYLGFLSSFIGIIYAIVIIENVYNGSPVEGWSSIMVAILLIGGCQLIMLGILGQYIWRNLDETRKRPPFIIEKTTEEEK